MVSKTFNRYIWLMNTFLRKKRLTFEQISKLWKDSYMGDGTPMPLRTFHQHRRAIEELFGVTIKCDTSDGYHYFIDKSQKLLEDKTRQWLLNSFSLSNMIIAGHNMKGRILFENIPHGVEYLQPVIEAMQQNKVLEVDYQPFGKHLDTYRIEPYALRVFHQRWYILGNLKELNSIRHLALDRVLDLQTTDVLFTMPEDFDAEKYYAYSVGIFVNDELKPQKVRIRVYGKQVEYLRTLPLHRTQEEVLTKHEQFSEFQYRVCLTPELSSQLLAMGEKVEVLEPMELREEIKKRLEECLTKYR